MSKKILIGMLVFLAMIGSSLVKAQGVYIETVNGDEISQQMEDINNGIYEGVNLVFNMDDNTTITYNLLEVTKMYFHDNTVINDELSEENIISVYPNPTTGQIQIENNNSSDINVSIYNIQGQLILSSNISSGNSTLDLSGNPAGVYVIKAENTIQKILLQ